MKETLQLLRQCQVQFQYYAQQHLQKATDFANAGNKVEANKSRAKSDVNLHLAERIELHIRDIHDESSTAPGYYPKPLGSEDITRTRPRMSDEIGNG